MVNFSEDESFRFACFTRKVYASGPGFWIPEEVKKELSWTGDCELGLIIFDEDGNRIFDENVASTSGGEIYLRNLLKTDQTIHVVVFRQH